MTIPEQSPPIDVGTWHAAAAQQITQALAAGRLGHALLVCGVPGIGKRAFARWLAKLLLCEAPQLTAGRFCEACKACQLVDAGTHPDYMPLAPEEPGKSIGVDAVRAFGARLVLTAQLSGNRAGILEPADAMTVNAANSLLKSLEEPPRGTYLVLVSDFPARLLPTVRSRCQRIELHAPANAIAIDWLTPQVGREEARRWLAVARGAPLRALALADAEQRAFRDELFATFSAVLNDGADPVRAASGYARGQLAPLLGCLDSWVSDLIRLTAAGPQAPLSNADLRDALRGRRGELDLQALFRYLDRIREAAASPVALNTQLAVEELLISAARLGRPAER